jgi:MFS family permease
MLIGSIAFGLLLGLLLGGRLGRLADIRLRHLPLLAVAVFVRFGTEIALGGGVAIADTYRVPLLGLGYGLLLFVLWRNRTYPGMALAFTGIASNGIAIIANGGRMPVWMPAYDASGITGPLTSVMHLPLRVDTAAEFLGHLGPLGDVVPIPIWPVNNVASIGDLFLSGGLAFFLFATVMRVPAAHRDAGAVGAVDTGSGLASALAGSAALERPLLLGSGGVAMASPTMASFPLIEAADVPMTFPAIAIPAPRAPALPRIRQHPYVRLALNGSFSALWVGQLISLFGDRVNQLALVAFVYEITKSPVAVAMAFLIGTIPNLVFSPIAGTFVDRWDQKQVLVVSDILRASLVLLIPVAVLANVWLAYPLVFLVTTVSIFFRPARVAVLPRIVAEEDLLAANSAMWVGETIADVVNYPIAGLFVVFLASSLPIAFWFDSATYLASALLLATMVVPPVVRGLARAAGAAGEAVDGTSVLADLKTGWRFLRRETVLFANTLQGTAGQFSIGIITVASLILAQQITPEGGSAYRGTYAFMETSIGVGNLVGGFLLGLVTVRLRKGLLVIGAYTVFGILVVLLGAAPTIPLVLGALFGVGVANMAFVIPSQTLFQERTPPELMGRVVSFRFALVFGGMSIAMGVGGLLVGAFGPGPVIAGAGYLSIVAGLAGLLVRAVREA